MVCQEELQKRDISHHVTLCVATEIQRSRPAVPSGGQQRSPERPATSRLSTTVSELLQLAGGKNSFHHFSSTKKTTRTRPTPATSQHISLLPYCQLCSQFFQHQIKIIFFFLCSSHSLHINIRLWTQKKPPSWKWSLKTQVIHRLIVPRAFPFKIFALRKWEVKN